MMTGLADLSSILACCDRYFLFARIGSSTGVPNHSKIDRRWARPWNFTQARAKNRTPEKKFRSRLLIRTNSGMVRKWSEYAPIISALFDDIDFTTRIINMKRIAVVVISVLIAACSSLQKSDSQNASGASDKSAAGTSSTNALTAAETESRKLAAEVKGLQQQSVYFDLDKSEIKPEYRNVILKQAEFIKAHKNDVVTVQGNTDERGSSEYNLALGERRANAARKSLELLDVPAAQIKTVSFGLEKPRLQCHEEKCWKENRRDDFVHRLD